MTSSTSKIKELLLDYLKSNYESYLTLEKVFGLPTNEIIGILYDLVKIYKQDFGNASQTGYIYKKIECQEKIIYTENYIDDKLISYKINLITPNGETIVEDKILNNCNKWNNY